MIAASSRHVYSWNGFLYGDDVATLKEELPTKLSTSDAAGMNGKRLGENFADLARFIVSGELTEVDNGNPDDPPLELMVIKFRTAHRADIGKAKLVLNSAADGRPARFVWAALEAFQGLLWEAPMTKTPFELSFLAEPERWYDDPQTEDLLNNQSVAGVETEYATIVNYAGPDANFYANADALPTILLTVSDLDTDQLGTNDPPYIEFLNDQDDQTFRLYPDGNNQFVLDSYEQGIRKGATFAAGTIYEFADYDQFLYLKGSTSSAGVDNSLTIVCRHCDLSVCDMTYYPRHW